MAFSTVLALTFSAG